MAQPLMSLDLVSDKAYRVTPKFDVRTPRAATASSAAQLQVREAESYAVIGLYNPELAEQVASASEAVTQLTGSEQWLKQFGLSANKLDTNSIMRRMGFKHASAFDNSLRKQVSSTYADGLFCRLRQRDGSMFNVTARKQELQQVQNDLQKLMQNFQRRIDWLTHGSRKLFGLIVERNVTILLDYRVQSVLEFEQFCLGLERLLREQLSRVERFNLIRCDEPLVSFAPQCVPATIQNVDAAVQWVHNWRRAPSNVSETLTVVEGLVAAIEDQLNEAVYLFSNGVSMERNRELLRERVQQAGKPVHVTAFNCTDATTLTYFGDLCRLSFSRLHTYRVTTQIALYEPLPYSEELGAPVVRREYLCGSVVTDAPDRDVRSTRNDVLAVFSENEMAKELHKQVQTVLDLLDQQDTQPTLPQTTQPETQSLPEESLNSEEWLTRHGLKARRLDFFDFLKNLVFRHADGVLDQCFAPIKSRFELALQSEYEKDLLMRPATAVGERATATAIAIATGTGTGKSSACVQHSSRLVNAQYCCRLFAHVRWPDGQLMHVQVSPEVYRLYEERMIVCLDAIEKRMAWLKRNSRAVFGTIVEEHVCLVIDTSESMLPHLQFLKNTIYLLFQEQIRHKKSFNIIAFNTEVLKWKTKLQPVTEATLVEAWQFVKSLDAYGTTNTQEALRAAMLDKTPAQGLYLLTDGRPDMPKAIILEEVESYRFCRTGSEPRQERVLPRVHCISFNCEDYEGDLFLRELAKLTCGRFHAFRVSPDEQRRRVAAHYSYPAKLQKPDGALQLVPEQPEQLFEGDDLGFLERELALGRTYLQRLQELRDQCNAKREKSLRNRQQRLDDAGRLAEDRRARLVRGKLGGALTSHAKLITKMRKRMCRTNDEAPESESEPEPEPQFELQNSSSNSKSRPRGVHEHRRPHTSLAIASDWLLPETRNYLTEARTPRIAWKRQLAEQSAAKQKALDVQKRREARRAAGDPVASSSDEDDKLLLCPLPTSPRTARKVGERIASDRQREQTDAQSAVKPKRQTIPSIKKWLRTHSLAARQLNLHDVLRPTIIMRTQRYVPILRKYIQAKVYSNSFQFGTPAPEAQLEDAHQSDVDNPDNKHEAALIINPLAVNLKRYIDDLKYFAESATILLNRSVWTALTFDQRLLVSAADSETLRAATPVMKDETLNAVDVTPESGHAAETPQHESSVDKDAKTAPDAANKNTEGTSLSPQAQELLIMTEAEAEAETETQIVPETKQKTLPTNAKSKFMFTKHRNVCLQFLEENGWPVNKQKSIEKLEREIKAAAQFLEQANEIHEACAAEIQKRKMKQTLDASAEKDEKLKKKQKRNSAGKKAANNPDTPPENDDVDEDEADDNGVDFNRNESVVARNSEDGLFYEAEVRKRLDDRTYLVEFSNPNLLLENRTQEVNRRFVLPLLESKQNSKRKKPSRRPTAASFKPGTSVLVRALNSDTSEFCYVPGTVVRMLEELPAESAENGRARDTTQDKDELELKCEIMLYNAESCRARLKNLMIIKNNLYDLVQKSLLELEARKKRSTKSGRPRTAKASSPS